MRPIPKVLLIHTVIHAKGEKTDRWSEEQLSDKETVRRVRMEPSSKVIRDKNSSEIQLSATLFYDCKNSRPQGMMFAVDDIIVFNGQKHKVQLVEPLYDEGRLHHYELGLIKYA